MRKPKLTDTLLIVFDILAGLILISTTLSGISEIVKGSSENQSGLITAVILVGAIALRLFYSAIDQYKWQHPKE